MTATIKRILPAAALTTALALVAFSGVAQATTVTQAKRYVRATVRSEYKIPHADVACRRESARRLACAWKGRSPKDVREGDTNGHSGLARVRGSRVTLILRDA